ncbi:uncharacterized protein ARMOST_06319 [Armillaria ostoyae]|uniref:Uncharacterized protein n=1 Tax=Armillaria ostoyae TaxID=47428 RepID=A0A284R2Q3_ARMOS|nr:uncharacterized protein ARMOST_06319 [Armillaria ostoyae]
MSSPPLPREEHHSPPPHPDIIVEAGSPDGDVDGSSSSGHSSEEGVQYDKDRHKFSKYHDHDFLRGLAENGNETGLDGGSGRFKVVAGDEAASIVRSYAGSTIDVRAAQLPNLNPVVFAFSTYTAGGRKVVDYYKTWKGIPKAHRKKGQRKTDFLDDEFRRVVKNLDKEYKRLSTSSPSSSPQIGVNKPLPHSPLTRQSSISANVKQAPQSPTPSAVKPLPKPPVLKLVDEPPPSGGPLTARPNIPMTVSDSVVSLPLLGPINGLTVHNSLPLRLVNPDLRSPSDSSFLLPDQAHHTGKHRRSKHRTASADSRHSKGSRTASDSGSSIHTSDESQGYDSDSPEILIVVVDENNKDLPTWHGLETNARPAPQPARAPSVRRSPWDGPLASTNGEVKHYGPAQRRSGRFDNSDESSEEEEEEPPIAPLRYVLSPPRTPPRTIPQTGYIYGPPSSYNSPYAASTANLAFSPPPPPYVTSLPTASLYNTPYLSPAASFQNLPSPSFPTATFPSPGSFQSPDSFQSFGAAPWVSAEEFHRYSNATTFQ